MQAIFSFLHYPLKTTQSHFYLQTVLHYLAEVYGEQENLHEFLDALVLELPEKESNIMTFGEQLRQQGMQQGMQQGVRQGLQLASEGIARDMILNGFDLKIIEKITKLPHEIILKLTKDIQH